MLPSCPVCELATIRNKNHGLDGDQLTCLRPQEDCVGIVCHNPEETQGIRFVCFTEKCFVVSSAVLCLL